MHPLHINVILCVVTPVEEAQGPFLSVNRELVRLNVVVSSIPKQTHPATDVKVILKLVTPELAKLFPHTAPLPEKLTSYSPKVTVETC